MSKRSAARAALAAALIGLCRAAWAQEAPATAGKSRLTFGEGILGTIVFGLIGIVLAIVGFKLFDVLIKHDIEKEIFENKNLAAAMLAGAVVLGVSLIIAATILS
jgi:uncharacterized membrane protein YjfL (UPF0719 family)